MYEKSIEVLNKAIADELYGVHQYMFFHFHCDNQGLDLLSGLFKRTAIEEMMHIELYADRILFLKGSVELKASAEVVTLTDVTQMVKMACDIEEEAIKTYNQWAMECGNSADSQSKKLLEDVIADEERHYSQYSDELEKLEKYGDNYLALQSIERSKTISLAPPGANKP